MYKTIYQFHCLEHYSSYFFSQNFLFLTWKVIKKTLTRLMIQHHTEFFPVERKKLIWIFINACLIIRCFSDVSSFNNTFINKGRIILTAKHLVHSHSRSCSIYGCEKRHQTYFSSGTSVFVVSLHFRNFSYLCVTISSVTGVGGIFGPTVSEDTYSTK